MTKKERERVKSLLKKECEINDFQYLYFIGWIHNNAAVARGLSVRDIACSELETIRRKYPESYDEFMQRINGNERSREMKKHDNVVPLDKTERLIQGKGEYKI